MYTPPLPCIKGYRIEVNTICAILKINGDDCFPWEMPALYRWPFDPWEEAHSLPGAFPYYSPPVFLPDLLLCVPDPGHHSHSFHLVTLLYQSSSHTFYQLMISYPPATYLLDLPPWHEHVSNTLFNSTKILLETPKILDRFFLANAIKMGNLVMGWPTEIPCNSVFLYSTLRIKSFLCCLGLLMPYSLNISIIITPKFP